MKETLGRLLQGLRFKLSPAHIAFLLVLASAGFGLAAWLAVPDAPTASTSQDGVRTDKDYWPGDQMAAPSRSLSDILAHPDIVPTHDHPLLGRQAPDFELADVDGKIWRLRELQDGRPVVLIFYYGFQCAACARQLFAINADLPLFREVGANVVAISADPPEMTRQRFQKYGRFSFPVLADPGNKVAKAYQVFREDSLRHGTFILDPNSTVRWVNLGDSPIRRNRALLCQLSRLGK